MRTCLGAVLGLLMAGSVAGQDLSRADPALRFILTHGSLLAGSEAPARPDAVTSGVVAPALERVPGLTRVRTLVRLGPGGEGALREAGAVIGTRAGSIVTARIPLASVTGLLSHPGILAVEAAATLSPLTAMPITGSGPPAGGLRTPVRAPGGGMATAAGPPTPGLVNDSAATDAGFAELRRHAGDGWEGLTGSGVVVGVYDSGLDLAHEDFLDPGGNTRVLFAWDQTVAGSGPGAVGANTFDYGTECTGPGIDQGSCPMVDSVGHGTHVAGILAGDGSATGRDRAAWRYPGGAPDADLIVVKGGEGTYTTDLLLDGVAYIFERAAALGRPAVVNISLSSQSGPHDGSTLFEEALDALSGPGRILVSGAGNAGDHRNTTPDFPNGPNHAQGQGTGSHSVRIPAYTPLPGAGNDGLLLELWYGGGDSLSVTVATPRGTLLSVATGDTASLETAGGTVAILNALDGPSPENGDHAAIIAILDAHEEAPPDTGLWGIDVTATATHEGGSYHLWLTGSTMESVGVPGLLGGTTNRYLVGVPGSADRVIAAGAHVTRHEWINANDDPQVFPVQEDLGDIAYFSSPGPRRDGVPKPDVTAPGKILISSLSADATLWDEFPWLVEADSVHVGLLGTSMAAPQVAAAVAVLLQLEPELTPEDVRDALTLSARADGQVGPVPNETWGRGKLDAAAAVERIRPEGLAPAEAVNLSENPVRGDALVINYRERPRSVAVYTLIGERVRGFSDAELGPLNVVWPLDTDAGGDVANGVYVVVVELPAERILRKIFVARP